MRKLSHDISLLWCLCATRRSILDGLTRKNRWTHPVAKFKGNSTPFLHVASFHRSLILSPLSKN